MYSGRRNLENGVLGTVPEVLTREEPPLDPGIAQVGIALDIDLGLVEKPCYFIIRHCICVSP